jgi:hypothetical protein
MMSTSKKILCAMLSVLTFTAHSQNLIQFADPVEVSETNSQEKNTTAKSATASAAAETNWTGPNGALDNKQLLHGAHPDEKIDLNTGFINWHTQDVFIPGNTGLDISISRSIHDLHSSPMSAQLNK